MKIRIKKNQMACSNYSSSSKLPILASNMRMKTEANINTSNGKIIFGPTSLNPCSNQLKKFYIELQSSTNQNKIKRYDSKTNSKNEKENKVTFPSILGNSSSQSNISCQLKNKLNIIKAYQPKLRM